MMPKHKKCKLLCGDLLGFEGEFRLYQTAVASSLSQFLVRLHIIAQSRCVTPVRRVLIQTDTSALLMNLITNTTYYRVLGNRHRCS